MELTCEQFSALFLGLDDRSTPTNLVHTTLTSNPTTEHAPSLRDIFRHLRTCCHCQQAYLDLPVESVGVQCASDNRYRTIAAANQFRPSDPAPGVLERLQRSDPNHHPYRNPISFRIACQTNTNASSTAPSDTDYSGSTQDGSLWQKERDFGDEETPGHSPGTPGISPNIQDKADSAEVILGVGDQLLAQADVQIEVVVDQSDDQLVDFPDSTVSNSGLLQPKRLLEQHHPEAGGSVGALNTLLDTGAVRSMIREDAARAAGFRADPNFKPSLEYCWGNSKQLVEVIGEHKVHAYDPETGKAMKIMADVVPVDQFTPGCDFIMSLKALSRTGQWSIQAGGLIVCISTTNDLIVPECPNLCCRVKAKNIN